MKWADRIVGALLILGCIPLWRMADRFPELGGAFPKTILLVLAGLSALMIGRSFTVKSLPSGEGKVGPKVWAVAFVVAGSAIVSALLMARFGYFPAMLALGAALFVVLAGQRRLLYVVAVSITLVAIFLVFALLLGVPLGLPKSFGQ